MVTPDTAGADLAVEATLFTDRMGWPVRIDGFNRIVMTTGARVDVFRMPTPLAEQVAYRLSVNRAGAPITRDAHWWSFITAPRQNPNRELPHQLREKQVYAVPSGGEVILPAATKLSSWWQQPRPERALPPWAEVVAVIRQVASRGS